MKTDKLSEHTANLAMGYAPAIVAKVGHNFVKPIPRLVRENNKGTFISRLMALSKKL